ncbi:hydroxypyruvate isomerase family protein [Poseidonocella pacifica]|nr:TIM barrel protein [Poseidonocella pacifica]
MLFTEHPLAGRPRAAAHAGFHNIEVLFPYALTIGEWSMLLKDNDLNLVLINTPVEDWEEGGRGLAAVPGASAEFRRSFEQSARYAEALDVPRIHVMTGIAEGARAKETLLENLAWAADQAPNRVLMLEPLNPLDMPGYYLNGFDLACEVLDTLGRANLSLQFDLWHAFRLGHDPVTLFETLHARVGHIQIAGIPKRGDPMSGTFDMVAFLGQLERLNYRGIVSGEYTPQGRTEDGLAWAGL